MMKENRQATKRIYEDLSKTLTDEEIVDAFVLPSHLSKEENEKRHQEFLKIRMQHLAEMSDGDIQSAELMRMKIQIHNYLKSSDYDDVYSFGKLIKRYLKVVNRSQSQFAKEISIHSTTLSRIINDKEKPSIDLMYRLEKHSEKMIPASLWYKVHSMKIESEIRLNKTDRKKQYEKVDGTFRFGQAG